MNLRFFFFTLFITVTLKAQIYLDQNSELVKQAGFSFDSQGRTQLCGPVSVVNWIQFQKVRSGLQPLNPQEMAAILLNLKSQKEIENGLTDFELSDLLNFVLQPAKRSYEAQFPDPKMIFNSQAALMLIGTFEDPRVLIHDPFYLPYRSFHWVLKVDGNADQSWVEFIDPEQPNRMTRMEVEIQESSANRNFVLKRTQEGDLLRQIPAGKRSKSKIQSIIELE